MRKIPGFENIKSTGVPENMNKVTLCVCLLMLICSSCNAEWFRVETASQVQERKAKEAAILDNINKINEATHQGNSVFTKCVLGYMYIFRGDSIKQMYISRTDTLIPQPLKCNE